MGAAGPRCKANIVHRNRLRRYTGSQPQTWFKDLESSQEQLPRDKPKTTDSRGKYLEREQDDSGNTNEYEYEYEYAAKKSKVTSSSKAIRVLINLRDEELQRGG